MSDETKKREPYEPPEVCRVSFAAGEVAATACKSKPAGGGPNRCQRAGNVIRAQTIGS